MHSIFPYIFTLGFWVIFFTAVNLPRTIPYAFIALMLWFLISVAVAGRKSIAESWLRWLITLLFLLASLGMVLVTSTEGMRNGVSILSGILAGVLIGALTSSSRSRHAYISRRFLELITFVYLITFWEVALILFFALVSYDVSIWSVSALLIPVTYLIARGIASVRNDTAQVSHSLMGVLVLAILELVYFLELLPIHYAVSATVLTAWLFFMVDVTVVSRELPNRTKRFTIYTILILLAMFLLFVTADWS